MKRILGLAIFASLFAPVAGFAQNELFTPVPEAATPLADQSMLEHFRKARTTAAVQVVKINADLLRAGLNEAPSRSVNLNFSADKVFAAVATKIDQRGENDFTWHGDVPGKPSNVTLVVKGDSITGSATIANELYAIEPLGSGLHAIIRKDLAKFPPEHPPGFEKIERSKKSFEERRDQPGGDSGQIIRVLVAYTPAVAAAHSDINSFVQLAIDEANSSYQNSQIAPRLELAHSYQVKYAESGDYDTDLGRFRGKNDGLMEEVHTLRDAHAADVAVLIFNDDEACGLASDIMAKAASAFAVVHHGCATGYYSFAHEIGHLQGARHNPEADPNNTPLPYGHGYHSASGHWRTVMSYDCPGECTRLPYWSNPNVNYQGAPMGTAQTHNNARVLNETARTLANFRVGKAGKEVAGFPEAAEELAVDERPALPFPPGVTVESQCGLVDDLQDVELYDGTLGVSKEYVGTNEPSTVQLQWMEEASIRSRLPDHSPGNIAGERWCTGTLFTDRLVLTAGHCFDAEREGWVTPFKIGEDGKPDYAKPEVLATLQVANFRYQVDKDSGAIRVPDVYPIVRLVEHRVGNLDYAIVELGPNPSGNLPRVTPASILVQAPVVGETLGIIQHPQGQPKKVEAGRILRGTGSSIYYNDIDTWGASSGSGVRNAAGQVIGVHTNGGCESDANRGVGIQAISAVSGKF